MLKIIGKFVIESQCLGKGQFGEVYLCFRKGDDKKHYACKVVRRQSLN